MTDIAKAPRVLQSHLSKFGGNAVTVVGTVKTECNADGKFVLQDAMGKDIQVDMQGFDSSSIAQGLWVLPRAGGRLRS